MGKNNKKGPKANVFKVAGAKSLKKTKAKAVNLGLKNPDYWPLTRLPSEYRKKNVEYIRRSYANYTKAQLEACLEAVRSNRLTQQSASERYQIPCSTIKFKLSNKTTRNPGRQPSFTEKEEESFVDYISTLSACGFSFTNLDIKLIIRDYLNSRNRTVQIFRNNIPGKDWLKSFLERHQSIYRHRVNIRAHVSEASATRFIQLLKKETEKVRPENIYNYDEISFGDDLLRSNVIWRREYKYPEFRPQAKNKGVSVLFCGNAVGETIPPFIVYASEYLHTSWTENGPDGACFTNTEHGWLDIVTFEAWFFGHLLPILQKKEGRKILIGDNLSSHVSRKVLCACIKNNIKFLCLPPHATQVLHPLDIAYFEPLETAWRHILLKWRILRSEDDMPTIFNTDFPYLLKIALESIPDFEENLVLSFKDTGIYPIQLPAALTRLKEFRLLNAKKRKLRDPPEKTGGYWNPNKSEEIEIKVENTEIEQEDTDIEYENTDNENESTDIEQENSDIEHENSDIKPETLEIDETEDTPSPSYTDLENNASSRDFDLFIVDGDEAFQIKLEPEGSLKNPLKIGVGDHVIVVSKSCHCPGQVRSIYDEGAYVNCMKKKNFFWRWHTIDTKFFTWDAILCKINPPKSLKKGCFSVPELIV